MFINNSFHTILQRKDVEFPFKSDISSAKCKHCNTYLIHIYVNVNYYIFSVFYFITFFMFL